MSRRLGAASLALVLGLGLVLGSCAKGQGSDQAFCANLKALKDRSVLLGGFNPSRTDDLSAYKVEAAKAMSQLERSAPRQIKPDVAVVADLTAEVAQLNEKYGSDRFELQQRLYGLARQRVGAASSLAKVSSYAKGHCNVDLTEGNRRNRSDSGSTGFPTDPNAVPTTQTD